MGDTMSLGILGTSFGEHEVNNNSKSLNLWKHLYLMLFTKNLDDKEKY